MTPRIRPWGRGGDIFLRRVAFQHLLLAGRPEQQKATGENPRLNKLYWEGLRNVLLHDGRNCEVGDCAFEGGDQQFTNMVNARVVRNTFANHMGYSWTALGGGAVDVVCEGNDHRRLVELGVGVDRHAARLLGAQRDAQLRPRRARGDDARHQRPADRPAGGPILGDAGGSRQRQGTAVPPLPRSGQDQSGRLQDRLDARLLQGRHRLRPRLRRRPGRRPVAARSSTTPRHGVPGQAVRHRPGHDGAEDVRGGRAAAPPRPTWARRPGSARRTKSEATGVHREGRPLGAGRVRRHGGAGARRQGGGAVPRRHRQHRGRAPRSTGRGT